MRMMLALPAVALIMAPMFFARTQADAMSQVRWLAGCWESRRGNLVTTEMWMVPDAGLMLGASRTTAGGRVRETERLALSVQEGRLVYTALPSRQSETSFTATSVSDSGFVVENPEHDFPKKISYRRVGADSLVARIEGPGRDGATRGIDFPMRRVACAAP